MPVTLEQWLSAGPAIRKEAVSLSLEKIRQMDGSIHAWVQVLPQKQTAEGTLSGIPFGVKDIIETENLVTEYGSEIYKGRRGTADAAIVRQLRGLGAIVMGKTQTTPFACTTPAPTRNPRNPEHTPGGSSSGSAAAVAAGMVPFAIGTQTSGSVLRPASYCGVTGLKATYGLFSMEGVLPLAHSLDTLGFFTSTPKDMLLLWKAMGQQPGRPEDFALGVPAPIPSTEPPMAAAFQSAISRLRSRGVPVEPVDVAPMLDQLLKESNVVVYYEGARFHEQRYREYGARLLDVADVVKQGLQISDKRYQEALAYIAECKEQIAEKYKTTPVILVPAATGPAPLGLKSTGDSRMTRPWTALGIPAVSIPMSVQNDLPLGLQLTAAQREEGRLLHTAVKVSALLDPAG